MFALNDGGRPPGASPMARGIIDELEASRRQSIWPAMVLTSEPEMAANGAGTDVGTRKVMFAKDALTPIPSLP